MFKFYIDKFSKRKWRGIVRQKWRADFKNKELCHPNL